MFKPLPKSPSPPVSTINGMVSNIAVSTASTGTNDGERRCHRRTGAGVEDGVGGSVVSVIDCHLAGLG